MVFVIWDTLYNFQKYAALHPTIWTCQNLMNRSSTKFEKLWSGIESTGKILGVRMPEQLWSWWPWEGIFAEAFSQNLVDSVIIFPHISREHNGLSQHSPGDALWISRFQILHWQLLVDHQVQDAAQAPDVRFVTYAVTIALELMVWFIASGEA